MEENIQHVFLVGAKNLGNYGGFETFINALTEYHQDHKQIRYHVACKASGEGYMDDSQLDGVVPISEHAFLYHNARCFKVRVPNIGPAQAIYYDVAALMDCCRYIRTHGIRKPVVYIMACRIGPFMPYFLRRIHKLGGVVYINPDGHEWKRAKWNAWVRRYWKFSEQVMVKYSDLVICDSKNIEQYIHDCYDGKGLRGKNPNTTYIAYGAKMGTEVQMLPDEKLSAWYQDKGLRENEYYLLVGRFVPENNYETIIREFMASDTQKDLAIITTANEKLLEKLRESNHFETDDRIKFVGTVYDQDLLRNIRTHAYGYIHGHEVGGTNPSLLEALAATRLNLLLDVGFNREVAEDSALYWSKEQGSLAQLLRRADRMESAECIRYGNLAKERIHRHYSWPFICREYERVFMAAHSLQKV